MILKLNYDLLTHKKGAIIDLERVPYKEKQYFLRRIKDSIIDQCVEPVSEKEVTNKISKKKSKKSLDESND